MADQKRRVRSPAYPTLSLAEAINKAAKLFEQEQRAPAGIEVIADAWDYEPTSSSVLAAVATLKHYGLLEQIRADGERRLAISDRAFDILIEPEGSAVREAAIREAALAPSIFTELWDQFGGEGSDANIKSYLLRRGFNRNAVGTCIRAFRETIVFAGLIERGTIKAEDISLESQQMPTTTMPAPIPESSIWLSSKGSPMRSESAPITILMDDGSVRVVMIPKLTNTELEFFKSQLQTFRKAILKGTSESTSPEEAT